MAGQIEFEASLTEAGCLDGSTVKVFADLDEVFEAIETKDLIEDLKERLANSCPVAVAAMKELAPDYTDEDLEPWCEFDPEPAFHRLSDWDMDSLRKAVREDDGRRAVDILREALS